MSDTAAHLAFLIDSPLMSWGVSSRFNQRETEAYPSKSALIGLIAAAMGIDNQDVDESIALAPLVQLKLTVLRLERGEGRPFGRLSDFHTVGGGFDPKESNYSRMSIPRKASGGPSGNASITRRTYLTEARFLAVFHGDLKVLEKVSTALLDPVWGIWFGRKTCIPAMPLSPILAETPREALAELLQKLGRDPAVIDQLEGVTEDHGSGTWFQPDQPVAFGQHHGEVPHPYLSRPVRRIHGTDIA